MNSIPLLAERIGATSERKSFAMMSGKSSTQCQAEADVVIGGFPCQDVSVNGKRIGINGKRTGLYRAMLEGIRRTRPKVFVAENVKGLLMKHHHRAIHQVVRRLRGSWLHRDLSTLPRHSLRGTPD